MVDVLLSLTLYHERGQEAMSNEELVARIQQGEKELLHALWEQVERFVSMQAGKRARSLRSIAGADEEDLYQSGFVALASAAESFDPSAGMSFIGWLAMHLKTSFSDATNHRSERQKRDPIHAASSLYAPLGYEGESSLVDIIPDPVDQWDEVEQDIFHQQLHDALEKALSSLSDEQSDTLRRRYYMGHTLQKIATERAVRPETVRQWEEKALRAMRHPRISKTLRDFVEERTPFYLHVGAQRYQTTHSSATEEIVLLRERLANRCGNSSVVTDPQNTVPTRREHDVLCHSRDKGQKAEPVWSIPRAGSVPRDLDNRQ